MLTLNHFFVSLFGDGWQETPGAKGKLIWGLAIILLPIAWPLDVLVMLVMGAGQVVGVVFQLLGAILETIFKPGRKS